MNGSDGINRVFTTTNPHDTAGSVVEVASCLVFSQSRPFLGLISSGLLFVKIIYCVTNVESCDSEANFGKADDRHFPTAAKLRCGRVCMCVCDAARCVALLGDCCFGIGSSIFSS